MFKGKLIENESYYKIKSKQFLLWTLTSILFVFLVLTFMDQRRFYIVLFGVYIIMSILLGRNQRRINSIFGNRIIEMDVSEIRIKSKGGNQQERINLNEVEKIILKQEYTMPETLKDAAGELAGKVIQNYLILHFKGESKKMDFEIDSYYMVTQLNKLIENWEKKGYKIETES